jgi:hypothetical protein
MGTTTKTPEERREGYRAYHSKNKDARNEQSRRYRLENPEKWRAIQKASREKRKEAIAAYMEDWRAKNKDRINAVARAYREENGELMNERTRKWRAENPVEYRMSKAERRAAELQATPDWADAKKIREVYREAVFLTKATGVPHHVDHEVPLRGKLVCGLHVHFNLRAIPAIDNIRKSNQFEPS